MRRLSSLRLSANTKEVLKRLPGAWRSPFWEKFGRHKDLVKKTVVTVVSLGVISYLVTTLVAWITAPRIEMRMSPVVGRIAVVAEPAKLEPIQRKVTYTGSVAAFHEVTVYPRVEGWVEKFSLYEGDRVRKGEVVARLDRAELTAAVERARAAVLTAEQQKFEVEADLHAAEAAVVTAKAGLAEAEANVEFWKKELPRFEVLVTRNAVAQSDYDNALKQAEAARARVEVEKAKIAHAQAKLEQMRKRIKVVEAEIEAAKAEWERRKTILQYTDIHALTSGWVSKRYIYAGQFVKPGMPIVDIQDLSRVRIQVKVAEPDAPYVRVGTEAIIRFPALPNPHQERRARVTTVFPQLDPVTRTTTVEVVIDNPGELIKTDMYAVVDLVPEKKEKALTIPRLAVLEGPDRQPIVYVTDSVSAMSRPVKLGIASGDRVEVLEGVKEGELVVWKGQRNLSEGAQVNLVMER